MSSGAAFGAIWIVWIALHPWLGKKGHLRVLTALVVLEVMANAAFWLWFTEQTREADISAAAAAGLLFYGGIFILLLPLLAGLLSLIKYRSRKAS